MSCSLWGLVCKGDDYDNAVQEVFTYFSDWEGCTMTEIGYAGDDAVKAEAEIRGLAPEQVMVLTSTFTTDGEDHQNGLEPNYTYEDYKWILTRNTTPNYTYEDYKWILTRNTTTEPWNHEDHGYG